MHSQMAETKQLSQQEFLQQAKVALGVTWDEFAERSGINARALKNYRLPDDSQNHRAMPSLAFQAVDRMLQAHSGKRAKKA